MVIFYSRAKHVEGFRVAVDDGRGHSVCLDLPAVMDAGVGPTPLELGVMSFSGCVAAMFALMAKKMRVPISDLDVKLKAEKPDDAPTVTKAYVEISVKTRESAEKINRVWKKARENCSVAILFEKAGVQVDYKLKIVKE